MELRIATLPAPSNENTSSVDVSASMMLKPVPELVSEDTCRMELVYPVDVPLTVSTWVLVSSLVICAPPSATVKPPAVTSKPPAVTVTPSSTMS